jgi:hypothetical protein
MDTPDPVMKRQLPLIAKIVSDETWLEGERRGQPVEPRDPVVQLRVCSIVLALGQSMREQVMAAMATERQDRVGKLEEPVADREAAA